MSRRTAEREARRTFILSAARRVFAEKGVEKARMDDIATAAEYTRRTLYAYFKSRDDICLGVLREDVARRWERQKQALAGVEGALDRLDAWAEALYTFWKENPQTMRLEQYWDFQGIERERIGNETFQAFEALNDELAGALRDIFRGGIEEGSIRPELLVDVCISQFLHSLRAVLARALSTSYSFAGFDPDRYVHHFLEQHRRAIRSDGEGESP